MRTHIRVLAWLQIVYASLGLLLGLGVLVLFGGVAAVVGFGAGSDSLIAVPLLAFIGSLAAGFLITLSLPRLIAGIGPLKHRKWARVLTMVLSVISLFDVPVGLALGLYAFWVLLTREGAALFHSPAAA